MSTLALQLASLPHTSTVPTRRPPSYIYTATYAASLSLTDLHHLASNAWEQLSSLDAAFVPLTNKILGEEAKGTDRMSLDKSENEKLDRVIEKTLRVLGKHAGVKPAGVVVEWLIRRFRVNELNVPSLIAFILPYHTTPHFPSLLSVISPTTLAPTPFSSLIPARASLAPLPLPDLISLLAPFSSLPTSRALLEFVFRLPLNYLVEGEVPHRALVGFWLQVVSGYLERAGTTLPEGERAVVLSTLLETVKLGRECKDLWTAASVGLVAFARGNGLKGEEERVVMKVLVGHKRKERIGNEDEQVEEGEGEGMMEEVLVGSLVVLAQMGEGDIEVKEGKKFLGGSGWKGLMRIRSMADLLVHLSNEYDSSRFMKPFLQTLATESLNDSAALTLLSSLLTPRPSPDPSSTSQIDLPSPILSLLTSSVFSVLITSDSSIDVLLPVLSKINQRHPAVYSTITTSLLSSSNKNVDTARLTSILSSVLIGRSRTESTLVNASESPDLALRLVALKELIEDEEMIVSNPAFVKDTILARLGEWGQVEIVECLLKSKKGREAIKIAFGEEEDRKLVFEVLKAGLESKSAEKQYKEVVGGYLVGAFGQDSESMRKKVVEEVVWGRILGNELDLSGSKLVEEEGSWIKGIGEGRKGGAGKIAQLIVENIAALKENDRNSAIQFLVDRIFIPLSASGLHLVDESSSIKANAELLALLVVGGLVERLDGPSRISFVTSVLEVLRTKETGLHPFASIESEPILDTTSTSTTVAENVLRSVETEPQSPKTLRRLRCAVLLLVIRSVVPPRGFNWDWLAASSEGEGEGEGKERYRRLAMRVYELAHTGTTKGTAVLSEQILHSFFTKLVPTSSILSFLSSIFTSSTTSSTTIKAIALQDSATFITVQAEVAVGVVDFQCFVPSLLVALMDDEKKVRLAGLETLERLEKSLPNVSTAGGVYGKDTFYGEKTSTALQYLDVVDLKVYLRGLLKSKVEISMDPTFVTSFHTTHLPTLDNASSSSSSKKKSKSLKAKILVYLLSHVDSWSSSLRSRTLLLRAISGIHETIKANLMVPLLEELVKSSTTKRESMLGRVEKEVGEEYCKLVLEPLRTSGRKWFEATENRAMEMFLGAVDVADGAGAGATIRKEALEIIRSSLFSLVRGEQRLDLFRRLVKHGAQSEARLAADYLECLRLCKVDGETLTSFLGEIRLSMASPVSSAAKRGRTSTATSSSRADRLPELIVILESIDLKSMQASHSLLLTLFDLLSTLIEMSASHQVDVQYAGQLILGSLAKVVENVQPSSNVTSDSIRMAPVLDLMRSSSNPQTSHQALLLLAQLGPLVPEQLAHNIMPIFTFMGANVLQRDDAYSLRVVDRTLESIVPVLVKSMKRTNLSRDALIADLKELLRVFTDAASHVPRHRRTKLFVRFVETLGASEFLSAVSLLLLDKAIKSSEAAVLPLAIFEGFSVDVQLSSLKQVIEEVPRLLLRGTPAATETPFLDRPSGSPDDADDIGSSEKLQVLNLVNFLAFALDAKQLSSKVDAARAAKTINVDSTLSQLVHGLLSNSSVALPELYTPNDEGDLATSINYALQATVRLMSTQAFSEAILWLLDLPEARVKSSALALLRSRLPNIKPTRRADISPAVIAVVERIQTSLVECEGALETLEVIAESVHVEEDLVLAKTVPYLLGVAGSATVSKRERILAMAIVKKLAYRLGPRLIPLAAKVIPFCVQTLRQEAAHPLATSSTIVTSSFQILEGLFTSIPTFIGGQLDKIFEAALSSDILSLTASREGVAARARAQLLSTAAKKLPAKTLYPAIIRLHASLDGSSKEPILALLDLLNRGLRQGKTVDIAENYRPIFKLFLTIFDLRRQHSESLSIDDINEIEENGLGAFTQFILKLNEQTFRPLFLRTYDWAVIDLVDEEDAVVALTARKTVLYKIVDRLLSQLKSIVVPYYSFMLDQTIELLNSFSSGDLADMGLWTSVTSALTKALSYDETNFWTALRLSKLSVPLANQLASTPSLSSHHLTSSFFPLLTAFSHSIVAHETLLKNFNTTLLMQTRSEDLKTKKNSLEALEVMWIGLGDGMLPLVPETTPFLAETLEELEGGVEIATKRLIKRIEEHLGETLDSYLEN